MFSFFHLKNKLIEFNLNDLYRFVINVVQFWVISVDACLDLFVVDKT